MDFSGNIIDGKKGDLVCRPADWMDVIKFFLMNYVLHAFTVISDPGSRTFESMVDSLMAMILPFSGIHRASLGIQSFSQSEPTDLMAAHRAGALCAVLPAGIFRDAKDFWLMDIVSPLLSDIHGHHNVQPVKVFDAWLQIFRKKGHNRKAIHKPSPYVIVTIPPQVPVHPSSDKITGKPIVYRVSHNNSLLKALVAILQIIYGTYELYRARGHQLRRFGYTAYSLTVVPYVLMSLCNLVSSILTPRYSSKFLVNCRCTGSEVIAEEPPVPILQDEPENHFEQQSSGYTSLDTGEDVNRGTSDGEPSVEKYVAAHDSDDLATDESTVHGAVGEVDREMLVKFDGNMPFREDYRMSNTLAAYVGPIIYLIAYLSPIAIMFSLTRFKSQQSTRPQQIWTIVWLVIGQTIGAGFFTLVKALKAFCLMDAAHDRVFDFNAVPAIYLLVTMLCMAPMLAVAVGEFVMVGKMIMSDVVCTRM